MTAAVSAAAAAANDKGDVDIAALVGAAGVLVAVAGLLLYLIGFVRPFDIRDAKWARRGGEVAFSCILKNRSPLFDRTVTALMIVEPPKSVFDRFFRAWRRQWNPVSVILESSANDAITAGTLKVGKNDELPIKGVLIDTQSRPVEPDGTARVEVRAGSKRSRSRRIRRLSEPPAPVSS